MLSDNIHAQIDRPVGAAYFFSLKLSSFEMAAIEDIPLNL